MKPLSKKRVQAVLGLVDECRSMIESILADPPKAVKWSTGGVRGPTTEQRRIKAGGGHNLFIDMDIATPPLSLSLASHPATCLETASSEKP